MTANQSRLLGVALLLSAIAVIARLAVGVDASGPEERGDARETLRREALEASYAKSRARLEAGAYIASRKRISDSEEIETVVIPEGQAEELDTRCLIYKNSELRTSSITCTGILFRQSAPPP